MNSEPLRDCDSPLSGEGEAMDTFAVRISDACENHSQWLSLVRFGMETLLKDQSLLIELIVRESERQRERRGVGSRRVSDEAVAILGELGLKFVVE